MRLLQSLLVLSVFILSSCKDIDIEQALDEASQKAEPISCTVSMNPLFYITQQAVDGNCVLDTSNDTVTYTPNSEDFRNTDFCTFREPEAAAIYRMNVDYSGSDHTCSISF